MANIKHNSPNQDLKDDVELLQGIPVFGSGVEVVGYMLDLKTGLLAKVEE